MEKLKIDFRRLTEFERTFDIAAAERPDSPVNITAFGEISVVLEIAGVPEFAGYIFKRLPIFDDPEKCREWHENCELYLDLLNNYVGVTTAPTAGGVVRKNNELTVFYTVQRKIDPAAIGNSVIKTADNESCFNLFGLVLNANLKVWDFNTDNRYNLETALDSQLSNWAVKNFNSQHPKVGPNDELLFLDTSTPFVRDGGRELMDAEAILKSAPSYLVWLVKLLFLEDVVSRYYDKRQNVIDIIANLYKEGRPDLIEPFTEKANTFFAGPAARHNIAPITGKEIDAYYRLDAFIWVLFLRLRKIDRFLCTHILGQPYHFMLPEKIERNFPSKRKRKK